MPRKKVSNNNRSPSLRQPTLAGFINSASAAMVNPSAEHQSTAKAASKSSKTTTAVASSSKSPTDPAPTVKPKIGPPKRRQRSSTKGNQGNTPGGEGKRKRKRGIRREKSPSGAEASDDGSDIGALQAIRFEPQEEETQTGGSTVEVTSSGEDGEDEIVSPRHPRRTATQARRKIRASSGSSDSDVEVIGGSAGAPRKGKRRLKRRLMSSDEEDRTETEEEAASSPKKRRLVKGLKPSTSEEEINLMDEVDEHRECDPRNGVRDCFLGGCADIVVGIVDSRLRTRGKKSAFQQSLETLKRMLPFAMRSSELS